MSASPVATDSTSTTPLYTGPLDSKFMIGSDAYATYRPLWLIDTSLTGPSMRVNVRVHTAELRSHTAMSASPPPETIRLHSARAERAAGPCVRPQPLLQVPRPRQRRRATASARGHPILAVRLQPLLQFPCPPLPPPRGVRPQPLLEAPLTPTPRSGLVPCPPPFPWPGPAPLTPSPC
eukprot:352342-Chlamydomonas_euryale.AAC.4